MAGVGFAAFTSAVTVNGTATGGSAEIEWTGTPTTSSGATVSCSAPSPTMGQTVLTVTVSGLGPGDSCSINEDILVESTSTDVTITSAFVASTSNMACGTTNFYYFDSYSISPPSPVFTPGTSHLDEINIGLSTSAVAACSGTTLTFTDTVTGTWAA